MTRKHKGIYQKGLKKGLLKKGYYYSGKKTKNGLPIIRKVHKGGGGEKECKSLNSIRDYSYRYKNLSGYWPTGFHPCKTCQCAGINKPKVNDCSKCAEEHYSLYKKGLSTRKNVENALKKAENTKKIYKKYNP